MQTPLFEERLYPSIGMYLAYALLSPMVLLAAAPFGWTLALSLGFVTLLAVFALATLQSPVLVVDDSRLTAGRMSIPLSAIGNVETIQAAQLRAQLGPQLDARAQLLIRGDLKVAVKVEIEDLQDPTPYLIISTRNPTQLVSALRAN